MSAEERNLLEWPSIGQLPRVVCAKVNRFLNVADLAALTIQRRHRGHALELGPNAFAGGYRHKLHQFEDTPVHLGEKFDGTNVGKMHNGTLLGRRQVIPADSTTYQKTDLTSMRGLNTSAALAELCSTASRSVLYGELCCNTGLYSYATTGVAKSWFAFGAILDFDDGSVAADYVRVAAASGFACRLCSERTVRVCNNPAFGDVMRRHKVPCVEVEGYRSLNQAIQSRREWMVSEAGEGLVLSVARAGNECATLYKWKISREPQPAAVSELSELLSNLRSGAGGKAVLLAKPIHSMVETLHAVATHMDSTTLSAPKPAEKTKAKARAVDAKVVQTAILSALTKFDALDTIFEKEGHRGITGLTERLVAEVASDTELGLPADGEGRATAVKEVAADVKRHVGAAFGKWRKGQ